ncbi:MAG: cation transporter [Lachnospiraceae bacterium]|nr:cation transporter [Lachnospiraceae bacterium]
MITLLSKLFIKRHEEYADPAVRRAYGVLCGAVGIFLNVLLFIGKFIAGTLASSVSVTADAFNNLSDAGSSVVTLIGFRLAGAKPDPEHPYGHGRIEYISGLIVAMVIILMGAELMISSVERIIKPEPSEFSWLGVGILTASILVKAYMFFYNRRTAKKIDSVAMKATATDSLTDCIATGVALLTLFLSRFCDLHVDGWGGAIVSLFVLYSGFSAAKDTISPLLGQPPTKELVDEIEAVVIAHEGVLGIHDLMVHDYGPGRMVMSLHAEVPAEGNVLDLHDMIDNIERELKERFKCDAVVHMDPVQDNDETVCRLKSETEQILNSVSPKLRLHDFRIVAGPTHTNLIFDVVVPFKFEKSFEEITSAVNDGLARIEGGQYFVVIDYDRDFVMQEEDK